MKKVLFLTMFLSLNAMATTITCTAPNISLKLTLSGEDIVINLNNQETALGVGLLSKSEVDVIARFPQSGEMTLFAKVGKQGPENYVYFQGKHSPIICR